MLGAQAGPLAIHYKDENNLLSSCQTQPLNTMQQKGQFRC